jgi:hypothetical protein
VQHSAWDWEEVNISTGSHLSHLSVDALQKNYRFHVSNNAIACAPQQHCRGLNGKVSLSDFSLMSDLNETSVWRQTQHTTEQIEAWTTAWAPWW